MLQSIRKFLLEPSLPLWKYVLLAFPLALVGSCVLFGTALLVAIAAGLNVGALLPPDRAATFSEILGTLVFAPVTETLILAGLVKLLSLGISRPAAIAACSAVLWGLFHGYFGALWFFGTVWSFFVFTCAYLAWRKNSFGHAFAAAALPHALINATAMALVFTGSRT